MTKLSAPLVVSSGILVALCLLGLRNHRGHGAWFPEPRVDALADIDRLVREGEFAAAIDQCHLHLAIDPTNRAVVYNTLGTVHLEAGQPAEAASSLRQALTLDPDLAEAHSNLGVALAQQGDLVGATHAFLAAVQRRPGLGSAVDNLRQARSALGSLLERSPTPEMRDLAARVDAALPPGKAPLR